MPKVKIAKVALSPYQFKSVDIPKLRGYLARMLPQYNEIHNHTPDGKFRFVYPELQFKYIDDGPVIIGYSRGIEVLVKVFTEIGCLDLNHRRIEIPEKSIEILLTLIPVLLSLVYPSKDIFAYSIETLNIVVSFSVIVASVSTS